MLVQILTTITSCNLSTPNIQIEPELVFTPDPLLPEINNRLLNLCKFEKTELKDIIFSVFETTTFESKKYVQPQSSFSYFSVNHLLVTKEALQIEVKLGKKGVANKNELQLYFQNKKVTNKFLQEILDSIKKSKSIFTGQLRGEFEKYFDLKFYETIYNSGDENAIRDVIVKDTAVKETFKHLMFERINAPHCFVKVIINNGNEVVDIKPSLMEIINELIDSGDIVIQESFEFQDKDLILEKNVENKINEKMRNKLISLFPGQVDCRINWGLRESERNENILLNFNHHFKFTEVLLFQNVIKKWLLNTEFDKVFSQLKAIIQFVEEFKKVHGYVKSGKNIESMKQNIEEYENILKTLKKDTETTVLIENHINLIKSLIKHSSEQTRIFNILNDDSVAFNFRIIYKDSNGKIKSMISKYYTLKEKVLHEIEEFSPTPPPKEPVKVKYIGILTKPWFYISLLIAFIVVRLFLMYFMSRKLYALQLISFNKNKT